MKARQPSTNERCLRNEHADPGSGKDGMYVRMRRAGQSRTGGSGRLRKCGVLLRVVPKLLCVFAATCRRDRPTPAIDIADFPSPKRTFVKEFSGAVTSCGSWRYASNRVSARIAIEEG